ncbi:hypothetical protein Tco_1399979 [Tanacetum coccineum]
MRDAQADVPSAKGFRAQLAFNKLRLVHGNLHSHQVSHFATFFMMGFANDPSAVLPVSESIKLEGITPGGAFVNSFKFQPWTLLPGTQNFDSLNGASGALGITAAAGTIHAPMDLVKGFRLYSFQLPVLIEPRFTVEFVHTYTCMALIFEDKHRTMAEYQQGRILFEFCTTD